MDTRDVPGIDRVLAALPATCAVASASESRLVVSPSGAFVVVDGGPDPVGGAHRARHLAASTRSALADHLSWVPFIDAVVVTTSGVNGSGATPVPPDLLAEVLVEGPEVIEAGVLASCRRLLAAGVVANWQAGIGTDAKIDLCEPPADAPTPH